MERIYAYWKSFTSFISQSLKLLRTKVKAGLVHVLKLILKGKYDPARNTYFRYRRQVGRWTDSLFDKQSKYYRPVIRIWQLFSAGILFFLVYIFCVETNFLWLMGRMPSIDDLQNPKVAQSSEIYTADGVLLRRFYTENRTPVSYEDLSPVLIKALIATEDIRFHAHSGVDPRAMGSVALSLLSGNSERGGGSTLTQQLAKKLFRTRRQEGRGLLGHIPGISTVVYKTKEWLTAIKLERNFTKEEIITLYFNTVDYGQNTYGIKTAAKTYFSKEPSELTAEEAAVLVGLQKATTTYNPIRNPKRSKERRDVVLAQMDKYGFLPENSLDSLTGLPLTLKTNFEVAFDDSYASYFMPSVIREVEKWGEENDYDLYTDGLKIYTTIDSRLQAYAEEAMVERMRFLQRVFEEHWRGQNPWVDDNGKEIEGFLLDAMKRTRRYASLQKKFNGNTDSVMVYLNKRDTMTVYDWKTGERRKEFWSALDSLAYYKRILRAGIMSMNPYTGHIKAWVGGMNHEFFKYDHVRQGRRQPGSTFKPFVYATAIDDTTFNMSPCDRMPDQPFQKELESGPDGKKNYWRPRNSAGYFTYANLTLRRAMAQSVNSVAAALTDKVGPENVVRYAKKLGINSPLAPVPSIGLGTSDVSLYEMVGAYSSFVNQGRFTTPVLVMRIEDRSGNVLHEFIPESHQALRPESAFLMVHMLKGGVEEPGGTSRALWAFDVFRNRNEIGGKTGTTSNNSDGWYISVTRDLVTGAWVGGEDRSIHFRTTQLGEGSKTALPIVGRFLEKTYRDKTTGIEPGPFPVPTFKVSKDYKSCLYYETEETAADSTQTTENPSEELEIGPPPPPAP
ncbi:MAG: transglycosylase [Cytophagaceae bacterium SCN 52-12]|nr:MAG: transglycosylase [Cytophagaceae bacterium SCN 52-12]